MRMMKQNVDSRVFAYEVSDGIRTLLGTESNVIGTRFKNNELINVEEEFARQHNIQGMTWLMLAALSKVYGKNWE